MLKKLKKVLQLSFILLALVSCKCKDVSNASENINQNIEADMVTEKSYNELKTLVLVTSFKNDLNQRKVIYYKVLDVTNDEILKQGSFEGTKLVWFTNNKLKGFKHIGMVKHQNDTNPLKENNNKENNFVIIDIK